MKLCSLNINYWHYLNFLFLLSKLPNLLTKKSMSTGCLMFVWKVTRLLLQNCIYSQISKKFKFELKTFISILLISVALKAKGYCCCTFITFINRSKRMIKKTFCINCFKSSFFLLILKNSLNLYFSETNGRPNTCGCSSSKIDCLIIPIPPHDPYYTSETPCITRQGSQTASGCRNLPAEQLNSLSAYINAETVYGWNEAILNQLRDHDSGELKNSFFHLNISCFQKRFHGFLSFNIFSIINMPLLMLRENTSI